MTPLRVATFNIAHGRGQDNLVDLRRTADLLADLAADIVCLQEVDRHFGERSGWADQGAELADALGMTSAYGAALTLPTDREGSPAREYGNAVLTRRALRARAVHRLPRRGRAEPRCLLLAELDELTVGCVHLQHNSADGRERQAAAVLAALPPDRPILLAGDFNAEPRDSELATLGRRLDDVWPRAGQGRGATFPSRWPRRRLDQVYVSAGLRPIRARVVASKASDHRPLVVDLVVE